MLKATFDGSQGSGSADLQQRWHPPCEGLSSMSRLARQILVLWLLAAYALVSGSGIALHSLLETGPSHHGHELLSGGASISPVTTHCPLCEYHAQGQLTIYTPDFQFRELARPHSSAQPALPLSRKPHASFSPRAPPLASLILI
jgi:hypothetical protein